MALGFEESKVKFREYIEAVKSLKKSLEAAGFKVEIQDDIELGATYFISAKGKQVARIEWNVPHYLIFENLTGQKEGSFSEDYVRSLSDWRQFLNDIRASIQGM
jgi:hypothetical protein